MEQRDLSELRVEELLALAGENTPEGQEAKALIESLKEFVDDSMDLGQGARIFDAAENFADKFQRDIMDPYQAPMSAFRGSYSQLVPESLDGTPEGKALGSIAQKIFSEEASDTDSKFISNLRGRINPFVDISSDRLLHSASTRYDSIGSELSVLSNLRSKNAVSTDPLLNRSTMVNELLAQADIVNAGGALFRPGLLPSAQMINEAAEFIDVDIFQLQNPAVVEMLVGKAARSGEKMRIRVRTATAWQTAGTFTRDRLTSDGRPGFVQSELDATGVEILGGNEAVMNALRRIGNTHPNVEVIFGRARNHQKVMVTDQRASIGSMNLTNPVGKNVFQAGSNFEYLRVFDAQNQTQMYGQLKNAYSALMAVQSSGGRQLTRPGAEIGYTNLQGMSNEQVRELATLLAKDSTTINELTANLLAMKNQAGLSGNAIAGGRKTFETLKYSLEELGKNSALRFNMILDQAWILQTSRGVLTSEAGLETKGEFGTPSAFMTRMVYQGAGRREYNELQKTLVDMIILGRADVVVDPRNYQEQIIAPLMSTRLGQAVQEHASKKFMGRLDWLLNSEAGEGSVDERVKRVKEYFRRNNLSTGIGDSELDGEIRQLLMVTSGNVQMAGVPRQHMKAFALFDKITGEARATYTGSSNFSLESMEVMSFSDFTGSDSVLDYASYLVGVSGELGISTRIDDRTGSLRLRNERGQNSTLRAEEFRAIRGARRELLGPFGRPRGPAWQRQVDVNRLVELESSLQSMLAVSKLNGTKITRKYDSQGNFTSLSIELNFNEVTGRAAGLGRMNFEMTTLEGGAVFSVNEGKVIGQGRFFNQGESSVDLFRQTVRPGAHLDLSPIEMATSLIATLGGEAQQRALVSTPLAQYSQIARSTEEYRHQTLEYFIRGLGDGDLSWFTRGMEDGKLLSYDQKNVIAKAADKFKQRFQSTAFSNLETLGYGSSTKLADFAYSVHLKLREATTETATWGEFKNVLATVEKAIRQFTFGSARLEDGEYKIGGMLGSTLVEDAVPLISDFMGYRSRRGEGERFGNQMRDLKSILFQPFLTYTQAHTYGGSQLQDITTILGLKSQQERAAELLRKGGIFQYMALGLPMVTSPSDYLGLDAIISVAGGVTEIDRNRSLSQAFGTRAQNYGDFINSNFVESSGLGKKITLAEVWEVAGSYGESEEVRRQIFITWAEKLFGQSLPAVTGGKYGSLAQTLTNSDAIQEFIREYSTREFIHFTTGGLDKGSQIAARLKNARGTRPLHELRREVVDKWKETGSMETAVSAVTELRRNDLLNRIGSAFGAEKKRLMEMVLGDKVMRADAMYDNQFRSLMTEQAYQQVMRTARQVAAMLGFNAAEIEKDVWFNPEETETGLDPQTTAQTLVIRDIVRSLANFQDLETQMSRGMTATGSGMQVLIQLSGYRPDAQIMGNAGYGGPQGKFLGFSDRATKNIKASMLMMGFQARNNIVLRQGDEMAFSKDHNSVVLIREGKVVASHGNELFLLEGNSAFDERGRQYQKTADGKYARGNALLELKVMKMDDSDSMKNFGMTVDMFSPLAGVPSEASSGLTVYHRVGEDSLQFLRDVRQLAGNPADNNLLLQVTMDRILQASGGRRVEALMGLMKGVVTMYGEDYFRRQLEQVLVGGGGSVAGFLEEADLDSQAGKDKVKAVVENLFGIVNPSSYKGYILGHGTELRRRHVEYNRLMNVDNTAKLGVALVGSFGLDAFLQNLSVDAQREKLGEFIRSVDSSFNWKSESLGEIKKRFFDALRGSVMGSASFNNTVIRDLAEANVRFNSQGFLSDGKFSVASTPGLLTIQLDDVLAALKGEGTLVSKLQSLAPKINPNRFSVMTDVKTREADFILQGLDFFSQVMFRKRGVIDMGGRDLYVEEEVISADTGQTRKVKRIRSEILNIFAAKSGISRFEVDRVMSTGTDEEQDALIELIAQISGQTHYVLAYHSIFQSQGKDPLSSKVESHPEIQALLAPIQLQADRFSSKGDARGIRKLFATISAISGGDSIDSFDGIRSSANMRVFDLTKVEDSMFLLGDMNAGKMVGLYYTEDSFKDETKKLTLLTDAFRYRLIADSPEQVGGVDAQGNLVKLTKDQKRKNAARAEAMDQLTKLKSKLGDLMGDGADLSWLDTGGAVGTAEIQKKIREQIDRMRELATEASISVEKISGTELAQDVILKGLEKANAFTFGFTIPEFELVVDDITGETRVKVSRTRTNGGIVLGPEFLKALKEHKLGNFVGEIFKMQVRMWEAFTPGSKMQQFLRELSDASRSGQSFVIRDSSLIDEIEKFYSAMAKMPQLFSKSFVPSMLEKLMGRTGGAGTAAVTSMSLALHSRTAVLPEYAMQRHRQSVKGRKLSGGIFKEDGVVVALPERRERLREYVGRLVGKLEEMTGDKLMKTFVGADLSSRRWAESLLADQSEFSALGNARKLRTFLAGLDLSGIDSDERFEETRKLIEDKLKEYDVNVSTAMIMRPPPPGNLELAFSLYHLTSVSGLNEMFDEESGMGFRLDPNRNRSLQIMPALSFLTTMLGDFDGDMMVNVFSQIEERELELAPIEMQIGKKKERIQRLQSLRYRNSTKEIKKLNEEIDKLERRRGEITRLIAGTRRRLEMTKQNDAIRRHVSAYIGADPNKMRSGRYWNGTPSTVYDLTLAAALKNLGVSLVDKKGKFKENLDFSEIRKQLVQVQEINAAQRAILNLELSVNYILKQEATLNEESKIFKKKIYHDQLVNKILNQEWRELIKEDASDRMVSMMVQLEGSVTDYMRHFRVRVEDQLMAITQGSDLFDSIEKKGEYFVGIHDTIEKGLRENRSLEQIGEELETEGRGLSQKMLEDIVRVYDPNIKGSLQRAINQAIGGAFTASDSYQSLQKLLGQSTGMVMNDASFTSLQGIMGKAGSDILGKTYNTIIGTLYQDSSTVAAFGVFQEAKDLIRQQLQVQGLRVMEEKKAKGIRKGEQKYIDMTDADLQTEAEKYADQQLNWIEKGLFKKYTRSQGIQGLMMNIHQILRDSIKPKGDMETFMNEVSQANVALVGIGEDLLLENLMKGERSGVSPLERMSVLNKIASQLGPGPGGLSPLIQLQTFVSLSDGRVLDEIFKGGVDGADQAVALIANEFGLQGDAKTVYTTLRKRVQESIGAGWEKFVPEANAPGKMGQLLKMGLGAHVLQGIRSLVTSFQFGSYLKNPALQDRARGLLMDEGFKELFGIESDWDRFQETGSQIISQRMQEDSTFRELVRGNIVELASDEIIDKLREGSFDNFDEYAKKLYVLEDIYVRNKKATQTLAEGGMLDLISVDMVKKRLKDRDSDFTVAADETFESKTALALFDAAVRGDVESGRLFSSMMGVYRNQFGAEAGKDLSESRILSEMLKAAAEGQSWRERNALLEMSKLVNDSTGIGNQLTEIFSRTAMGSNAATYREFARAIATTTNLNTQTDIKRHLTKTAGIESSVAEGMSEVLYDELQKLYQAAGVRDAEGYQAQLDQAQRFVVREEGRLEGTTRRIKQGIANNLDDVGDFALFPAITVLSLLMASSMVESSQEAALQDLMSGMMVSAAYTKSAFDRMRGTKVALGRGLGQTAATIVGGTIAGAGFKIRMYDQGDRGEAILNAMKTELTYQAVIGLGTSAIQWAGEKFSNWTVGPKAPFQADSPMQTGARNASAMLIGALFSTAMAVAMNANRGIEKIAVDGMSRSGDELRELVHRMRVDAQNRNVDYVVETMGDGTEDVQYALFRDISSSIPFVDGVGSIIGGEDSLGVALSGDSTLEYESDV